ncbi:MAG: hypothetical protein R2695_19975 [Acidimicrobiales bacterium]
MHPLLNQRGDDYYVVLQNSPGVPAVRIDVAALGPREESLLATEEGREMEASALADAVISFLVSDAEGDGFVEPTEPVRDAPTTDRPSGCSG